MKNLFQDINFNISQDEINVVLPIISGLIGFIIFWFSQESSKLRKWFIRNYSFDKGSAYFIFFTKILGAFSIGFIPLILFLTFCEPANYASVGLTFEPGTLNSTVQWTALLSFILIPMIYRTAKKPSSLSFYPQVRSKIWTPTIFTGNLLSWTIYLFGYELFFRGILLFPLVESIGIWPAIAINVALYSATHIPKGASEAIGAIPLAIILCFLSLATGSIWIAFFVHLVMAITNTLATFKFHPDMQFSKNT